jgi:tetratricopeptide (TPR) repeat protein
VALLAGAQAVVLPAVHRFDRIYALEVQVLDPSANDQLFTLTERGRKAALPSLIDALSERIRRGLRESPRDVQAARVPVASATTSSLEAYAHYFEAMRRFEGSDTAGAVRELRRAVAIDPSFALAHYQLARLGEGSRALPVSVRVAAADAALRGASRLAPRDRLLVEALGAHVHGRDDQAEAAYRRLAEAFPADKEALYAAGDHLHHRGRPADAAPYFERALALDPGWSPPLYHLIGDLVDLGRPEEAEAEAERAAVAAPSSGTLDNLLFARLQRGRTREALEVARRQAAVGAGALAAVNAGETHLLMEDPEGALAEAGRLLAPDRPLEDRCAGLHLQVKALALAGRRREALERARAPVAEGADARLCHEHDPVGDLLAGDGPAAEAWAAIADARAVDPTVVQDAALVAYAGDLEHAAQLAADLDGPWRTAHDAVVRWRSGDADGAVALLRRSAVPREGPRVFAAFLEGQIRAGSVHPATAEPALRAFLAKADWPYWPMWRSWAQPRAHLLLARALADAGRPVEARAEVRRVLRLWARADPDLPDLAEARALEGRLGTPVASPSTARP